MPLKNLFQSTTLPEENSGLNVNELLAQFEAKFEAKLKEQQEGTPNSKRLLSNY